MEAGLFQAIAAPQGQRGMQRTGQSSIDGDSGSAAPARCRRKEKSDLR
jgi:hypothetical protein